MDVFCTCGHGTLNHRFHDGMFPCRVCACRSFVARDRADAEERGE